MCLVLRTSPNPKPLDQTGFVTLTQYPNQGIRNNGLIANEIIDYEIIGAIAQTTH
jgi:hypothetical protein